jgi:hypothetical protein
MNISEKEALKALQYHKRLRLRRLTRHRSRAEKQHKYMFESLQIDGAQFAIDTSIAETRKALRALDRIEKKVLARLVEKPQNKLAGQNQGGAPSPLRR